MNLIFRSLQLDREFCKIPMRRSKKLFFILKKYFLLFKNFIFGFMVGESYAVIDGSKYFYNDKFGIAFLQSVYVDNYFIKNFIDRDSIVVDVGANIGQFNFFCKHYLRAKKIFSFEPIKETYKVLKLNSPENIYHKAVAVEKDITFYVPEVNLMASTYKIDESDVPEKVEGIAIDSIAEIASLPIIDLFKIDTEGTELNVLKASKETLKKAKYILIEVSISRKSDGDIMEVLNYLKGILPGLKLIQVGRPYEESGMLKALDILFHNPNI